jgi:hypothetical protein
VQWPRRPGAAQSIRLRYTCATRRIRALKQRWHAVRESESDVDAPTVGLATHSPPADLFNTIQTITTAMMPKTVTAVRGSISAHVVLHVPDAAALWLHQQDCAASSDSVGLGRRHPPTRVAGGTRGTRGTRGTQTAALICS